MAASSRISIHSFRGETQKPDLEISIVEDLQEEYGLFVWPSSVILAEYVWQQRSRFAGAHVIELGAGTSLPGLVAAKIGSYVTLTDREDKLEVLENMKRMCDLNGVDCHVLGLTWGVWNESTVTLKSDFVLGADVLYDSNAFNDLFATVSYLLQARSGSSFITTYHDRSGHKMIKLLMAKWGLRCVKLIDGFTFMPSYKASGITGNIHLVEIKLEED